MNSKRVLVWYTKTFNRHLKKLKLNSKEVKDQFESKLNKWINYNPNSYQFPRSGAGIGNVWKIRINGSGGERIIYFAEPFHYLIIALFIYPKNKQANLTDNQKAKIKDMLKYLKEIVNNGPKKF